MAKEVFTANERAARPINAERRTTRKPKQMSRTELDMLGVDRQVQRMLRSGMFVIG